MATQKVYWVCSTRDKAWRKMDRIGSQPTAANLRFSGMRHQTWTGFGGCFNELGWQALQQLSEAKRAQVLRTLFHPREGCRFSFCRMPIGASDYAAEWYSCNETPGDYAMKHFSIDRDRKILIPYIKAAQALQPDLKLFASPWSPPTWMKSPRAYNYGTLIWEKKNLAAYALYFARFVEAYAQQRIPITQLHVQNEPVADQKFPSCLWTGAQMAEFIRDYLGPTFAKRKLSTEIWLGTINSDNYNEYANQVLSDPGARKYIGGVSYQWAGKHAIARTLKSYPEVPLMQSENECGDGRNTWDYAHYIFDLFLHYIVNGVRSYMYWNMVLPAGGISTWGWRQNSMVTVDMQKGGVLFTPEFHVMKHFAHYIQPGAVRLGLTGQCAGNAVCFLNPDGSMPLVIANPFEQPRRLAFNHGQGTLVADLPPRSFNTFDISLV